MGLTRAQLDERMRREARRVRDRNYRFRRMTPVQQRVTIARDVLKLLEAEKITAMSGVYMNLDDDINERCWDEWHPEQGEGVQLHELIERTETCEVCGIGACFVAAVRRNDRCEASDMKYSNNDDFMRKYLREWFPKRQIELIEAAFEADTCFAGGDKYDDAAAAKRFGDRFTNEDERLRAIFQNIVENDGRFDPTDVQT